MSDHVPLPPASAATALTAGASAPSSGKRSVLSRLAESVFKNPMVALSCALGGAASAVAVPLDIAEDFGTVAKLQAPDMGYSRSTADTVQSFLGVKERTEIKPGATIAQQKAAIEASLSCTTGDLLGNVVGGTAVAVGLTALTGAGGAASGAVTAGRAAVAYKSVMTTAAAADVAVTSAGVIAGGRDLYDAMSTPSGPAPALTP